MLSFIIDRTKVQHLESVTSQLEQARAENSEVKSRLQRVESEYHSWVNNEQELATLNNRLKTQLAQVRSSDGRVLQDANYSILEHSSGTTYSDFM